MSLRGQDKYSARLQSRMKVNFFYSGWRHRALSCTSRVDVAAWAGQVLGTSPVEDEG